MLTYTINKEETEMATNPADRHPKSREMDQKSRLLESGTCHIDKDSLERRKTSQKMGRRLE